MPLLFFITSRSEFATLTYKYKVSALDFIDKETSDQVFKNRVADCVLYTKTTLLETNQSLIILIIVIKEMIFVFLIMIFSTLRQLELLINYEL